MQDNSTPELDQTFERVNESFNELTQSFGKLVRRVEALGGELPNTEALQESVNRMGRSVNIFLLTVGVATVMALGSIIYSAIRLEAALNHAESRNVQIQEFRAE